MEKTLSIIKPDAVAKNVLGKILDRFESAGLKIIAIKMLHLDKDMAEGFYVEHKGKPFFEKLAESKNVLIREIDDRKVEDLPESEIIYNNF